MLVTSQQVELMRRPALSVWRTPVAMSAWKHDSTSRDQLASARLRAVARIAALQKTPTSAGGGRRSSAETAAGAVSQGEGLYSDAVVPEGGLEPPRPLVGH